MCFEIAVSRTDRDYIVRSFLCMSIMLRFGKLVSSQKDVKECFENAISRTHRDYIVRNFLRTLIMLGCGASAPSQENKGEINVR